jgi:AbrB family looped-hinge helix DNA binding protein
MAEVAAALDSGEKRYEATVTTKGQVTLPQRMRLDLDIREGDRLVFAKRPDGTWVLSRILGEVPDIDALRGMGKTEGVRRSTDDIMEDLRGRRPGEPLP